MEEIKCQQNLFSDAVSTIRQCPHNNKIIISHLRPFKLNSIKFDGNKEMVMITPIRCEDWRLLA